MGGEQHPALARIYTGKETTKGENNMKRAFLLVSCLMLVLYGTAFAGEDLFETLSGLDWTFCSGAGGWSTDMRIRADGTFAGEFHDSEMGDTADDYPYGTVYFCAFTGRMSLEERVNDNTWKIRVEILEEERGTEAIEDGVRFVPTGVYGLSEGDEMLLYCPGTPVGILSEEMQLWAHVIDQETPPTELEDWFLMSEQNDSGFVGYPAANPANPWEDLTAEKLKEESGLSFGVPEGTEKVLWRYLRSEGLAEMQFVIGSDVFCARIMPVLTEDGQLRDISGMECEWINE